MNGLRQFIDFILPPRCAVTGDIVEGQGMLSPSAWRDLNFISDPKCLRCGLPFEFIEQSARNESVCAGCLKTPPIYHMARSALFYDDFSRNLILGFKHGDQTQNIPTFIPWLERAGAEILDKADFLMPIPLHPFRLMKRRFNQSGLMAQGLSTRVGIPVLLEGLKRTRSTPVQGHLQVRARAKNVRNAFAVEERIKPLIKNKHIVLIDDVYTTGATVNECTKVLLKNQAGTVSVLTLARVVKPSQV